MAKYTQDQRPFKVESTLGEDVLLLEAFAGEEGVSAPFSYALDLLSEDDSIDATGLLRSPLTVTVKLADGGERPIHGLVRRFVQSGQTENGELTSYQAEIVPWLWFLSQTTDCRIFQNLTVLEIVEQVFKSQGYSDFELRCVKSYAPREYCVQYRESHLNFVSRLLEEEGIFYFFEHSASKHVLVLADDASAVKPCPGQSSVRAAPMAEPWQQEDVVTGLLREHNAYVGTVTLRDYDHLQPGLQLETSVAGEGSGEVYDYPGRYVTLDEGERVARLLLEEREAWREVVRGTSTCRAFRSGYSFELSDHYRDDVNQEYQLIELRHSARAGDYKSWDTAPCDYRNEFVAIPSSVPFRPPRRARKPVVRGSQTAVVVGKSGEEIWVDAHGRVKVQFFWDRDGKRDENSSCWVRISSTWAGKNWGFISIPRIGQEVVVDFLEGDPDRPLITGSVYNAEQAPPYDLPGSQTQSGLKSRSSKGGGPDNCNEIRMEDAKGSELLFIQAEKDEQTNVKNDRSKTIGHDEQSQIGNDRTRSVGNNESVTIGKDASLTIGANRTKSVTEDETVSIGKNRNETVGKDEDVTIAKDQKLTVGGTRKKSVAGDEIVTVGRGRVSTINMGEILTVALAQVVNVGLAQMVNVGSDLMMNVKRQVSINCGQSSIVLKADGTITIKGKDIQLDGSGNVAIKAASTVATTAQTITQN
jgi:type VI secretion system secreted protein VgrG